MTTSMKILQDLMFWNHPYGEDNFSIIIKCRKCYGYWLDKFNKEKESQREVILSQ